MPARRAVPCLPRRVTPGHGSALGLNGPVVVKVPLSSRRTVYEPSWFFLTLYFRWIVSVAHTRKLQPWSSVTTLNSILPPFAVSFCPLALPLPPPGSARPVAANAIDASNNAASVSQRFMKIPSSLDLFFPLVRRCRVAAGLVGCSLP